MKISLICTWHMLRPTAMQQALLGCIMIIFPTDVCLNIACFQTYIVGYENTEASTTTGEVFRPRKIRDAVEQDVLYNISVTIFTQAPELQHVTWECETMSMYSMFLRTTIYIHTIFRMCGICSRQTTSVGRLVPKARTERIHF